MTAGRLLLLVLILLAGSGFGIVFSDPIGPSETTLAAFAGVFAIAFWWLVIGLVVWLIRVTVRRRRRLGSLMLSTGMLVSVLVLACASTFGSLGLRAQDHEDRLAAPSAAAADTDDELSLEQEAIVDYINGYVRCVEGSSRGPKLEQRMMTALERGDWSGAERQARRQRANLGALHACLDKLAHGSDPELNAMAGKTAGAIAQMVSGYDAYVRGTSEEALEPLDLGDKRILRARRQARRAANAIDDLYQAREPRHIADYIDFERLLRVRDEAGLF